MRFAHMRRGIGGAAGLLLAVGVALSAAAETLPGEMAGTWAGTGHNRFAEPYGDGTLRFTLDVAGRLDGISVGEKSVATTGELTREAGNVYRVTLAGGVKGYLFFDPLYTHAFYVDANGSLAILAKGETAPKALESGELAGVWTGTEFRIASDFTFDGFFCSAVEMRPENGTVRFTGQTGRGAWGGTLSSPPEARACNHYGGPCDGLANGEGQTDFYFSACRQYALSRSRPAKVKGPYPTDTAFAIWMRL